MTILDKFDARQIENIVNEIYAIIIKEPNLTPRSKKWIKKRIREGGLIASMSGNGPVSGFIFREHIWGDYYEIKSWYCRPEDRGRGLAHELFRKAIAIPGKKYISVTFFYSMTEKLRRYGYEITYYYQLPLMVTIIFLLKRPLPSVLRHLFKRKSYLVIRK